MTFSLYPEDEPPQQPELEPSKRRRMLIWAGGAAAAIVALAAGGWLVFGNHGPGADRSDNGSVVMPAAPQDPVTASPDSTGSAAPSGSAPASRSASPTHSGPAAPTGGPGTPAPGLPVSYRVTTTLCPAVNLAPLSGLAGTASGSPEDQQKDYGESGYTDYSCLQRYGQGSGNIQAEIFGSPSAAGAWYDTTRGNTTGTADVAGVGTAAFDYLVPGSNIETYRLWVRDGNLGFGVTIQVKGGNLPTAEKLRAAAVSVAKASIPKLRG